MMQWEALVRVENGTNGTIITRSRVYADNVYTATLLFRQQYGQDSVISVPNQVTDK